MFSGKIKWKWEKTFHCQKKTEKKGGVRHSRQFLSNPNWIWSGFHLSCVPNLSGEMKLRRVHQVSSTTFWCESGERNKLLEKKKNWFFAAQTRNFGGLLRPKHWPTQLSHLKLAGTAMPWFFFQKVMAIACPPALGFPCTNVWFTNYPIWSQKTRTSPWSEDQIHRGIKNWLQQ